MFREVYDLHLTWAFLLPKGKSDITLGNIIDAMKYIRINPDEYPNMSRELYIYALRLDECTKTAKSEKVVFADCSARYINGMEDRATVIIYIKVIYMVAKPPCSI